MTVAGEGLPSSFDGRGRQRLQRSEIRKVCLRRVVPLRFVKIESVWLCREPIKIADQAGPSVVEHPLNDAGGSVFVAAISLEHRALAFVAHGLRFPSEVGGAFRFAVALF